MRLDWLNGWIFLPFLYMTTEGLVKLLPNRVATSLTDNSGWTKTDTSYALIGGIPILAFFILLALTPLKVGSPLLLAGLALFLVGAILLVDSILRFRAAMEGQPVTGGMYRFSRNPQTIGLFIENIGASLAIGSWAALAVALVLQVFLHLRILAEEKTCLAKYGASYREYMKRVPRYILFL